MIVPERVPADPRVRRRTATVVAVAAATLVVVGVVSSAFVLSAGRNTPDAAAWDEARARTLEARLELAAADRIHLLLEPDRGTLKLFQGGAELRVWPVGSVAAGARRIPGARQADWRSALWDGARLDPPVRRERRVIVSDRVEPVDPTGAVEWIPPTPEEEVPAPQRFVVHFPGGLGVEVLAPGADTLAHRPRLRDRFGAGLLRLAPSNWDRYRIQLVMEPSDAGALYRSLPEGIAFLAVLPEP